MLRRRVKFTFPPEQVSQPVVYLMGKQFDVVTNIRRANVTRERGWVVLELSGGEEQIERALEWAREQGVRVDALEGDVLEG